MEIKYRVIDTICNFVVYKTGLLSEAIKYVESQDEPSLYEVYDIKAKKIIDIWGR